MLLDETGKFYKIEKGTKAKQKKENQAKKLAGL